MKPLSIGSVLFLLILTACKISYGPVIHNSSSSAVEIWAEYTNGEKSYVRLEPGTGLWRGKPGYIPAQIVTLQAGTRLEFDQAYLLGLFGGIKDTREAVVLFDGVGLKVLPMADAKRRKLM